MSKLFYDHLIKFEKVEKHLKACVSNSEERQEIWKIIDEIIHNTVLTGIFDVLPKEYHQELLVNIEKNPHDENHLVYINEKCNININIHITKQIEKLEAKIIKSFL